MIDPTKKLDRTLMFIPGFLSWSMMLAPIWLGLLFPKLTAGMLAFIAVYWLYMAIKHAKGLWTGYNKYQEALKVDWQKKCIELQWEKLPNPETLPASFEKIKHFILIPTYTEPYEILEETFEALLNQKYDISKITIVIGTEEVGEQEITKSLDKLKEKYKDEIPRILHYIHPKGIPNEIVGVASANRTWAASHAVKQLESEGERIKDYIFTTFDSDVRIHEQYLSCLTYNYLTDGLRFNRFYETAVHLYGNNIWEVPLTSRIEANNITFGLLSSWTNDNRFAETFSCYSCALDTVVKADYWDVKFIDDTVFFWRAFVARKGNFTPTYFHIPISSDATSGTDYLTAHKNLFRQLIRWGWGSVSTVMALKIFITEKLDDVTLEQKILWTYFKIERHLLARTSVFLITFGFLLLTFVNQQFRTSSTVYGLPELIRILLTAGILMFIPLAIIRKKIYPPPENWTPFRKFLSFLEGPLVMINLLTFSFLPWLYAETMMMFGKLPKVTFYTPKTR